MEKLENTIKETTIPFAYTVHLRNYLNSHPLLATKQTECTCRGRYTTIVTLFPRDKQRVLFCVKKSGYNKKICMEGCYYEVFNFLKSRKELECNYTCKHELTVFRISDSNTFKTQGLDSDKIKEQVSSIEENSEVKTISENVEILGAAEDKQLSIVDELPFNLLNLSSSEKIYDFTSFDSGIMSRFMPLETVNISSVEAQLVKSWRIIEDLVKINSIVTLPIQGFMLGHYDLEFKMIVQGVPQQACSLMLGYCPNPYGLYEKYVTQVGWNANSSEVNFNYPAYPEYQTCPTYLSIDASVMRPNVQLSLESQGEVTLRVKQKYHKTMIRNFDYFKATGTNPGIRGGFQGLLTLHTLTPVLVGTGTVANFDVRILFRFVEAKVAAMTQPIKDRTSFDKVQKLYVVPSGFRDWENFKSSTNSEVESKRKIVREKYQIQGPVMSVLSTVKMGMMTATDVISSVENITNNTNKRIRNKDKPIDVVSQVTTIPRPRLNFTNGEGTDSAIIAGISWVELTNILQSFEDEPKSYKDLLNIPCLFKTISILDSFAPGTEIWNWSLQPTDSGTSLTVGQSASYGYSNNWMRTTVGIVGSGFTNYTGTMILCGHFIKTMFHKASIEIAIRFGRELTGDAMENSYVTIVNIQDTSAFEVIIPYIYDTPMRPLTGTSNPICLPNITNTMSYGMAHSASISIRVLNRLIVGSGASSEIKCLLWLKGGKDFSMNFPKAYNCNLMPEVVSELLYTPQLVSKTQGLTNPKQFLIVTKIDSKVPKYTSEYAPETFVLPASVQANEPMYSGNILTNVEHLNFKSILKMPVKVINYFAYTPWAEYEIEKGLVDDKVVTEKVRDRNYFTLPVAPLNSTSVQYLTKQIFGENKNKENLGVLTQNHHYVINTMFGMYSGSICYTIVIDEGDAPVYWAYLPHDYSLRKLYGPLNMWVQKATLHHTATPSVSGKFWKSPFLGTTQETFMDFSSSGSINGIIIPRVNPTEKIVIPMSAALNWLLMNRSIMNDDKFTLQTMRENSEWFNGHLAVWSNKDFKFSVYQNCGDEFELGGFIGHPGFPNPYAWYNLDDDRRVSLTQFKVQGPIQSEFDRISYDWLLEQPIIKENFKTQGPENFHIKDLTQQGWKSLKQLISSAFIGTTTSIIANECEFGLSPAFGAIAIYSCVGGIQQLINLKRMILYENQIPTITNVVQDSVQIIKESTEEFTSSAMMELKNMIDALFPFLKSSSDFIGSLWKISQHLIHAAIAQNWANAAFAAFCVVLEMKLLDWKDWKLLGPHMENYFIQVQGFSTQGIEESGWTSLMQVLTAIICAKVQVKSDAGLQSYLAKIFCLHDYRSISGINSILSLVKTFMNAVSVITNWAFKEADPNIVLLTSLQNQGEDLEDFAHQASEFLTFFSDLEISKRENRIKYLSLILRAIKIREILIRINNPHVAGPLLQTCIKVIEKANSVQYLLQCDIVKQEPFILFIEGKSNIGKSFAIYKIIGEMFKRANFVLNTTDYIYTVNLGLEYMNGLRASHIAWYIDDIYNIRDIESVKKATQIMFGLKTSSPYNVPRAEIENKEQIGQPLLVVCTSNEENTFPVISEVQCSEALYRRRDYLVRCQLKNNKEFCEFSSEDLDNFNHLECIKYNNVTLRNSLQYDNILTFEEFLDDVSKSFVEYLNKEKKNQFKKYQYLMECMSKNALDSLNIGNPFELINQCNLNQPEGNVRMMIEDEVEILVQQIKQAEYLASKIPSDEQLFEVQGIVEKFQSFRLWFSFYVSKIWKFISNKTIRCLRCSDRAFSGGVSLWCEDGSHYICLACATHDLDSSELCVLSNLRCPMHPSSRITCPSAGLIHSMFANYVDQKILGSNMSMQIIATTLDGGIASKEMLIILRVINITCSLFRDLSTQGIEEIPNFYIGDDIKDYLKTIVISNYHYPIDNFSKNLNYEEKFYYYLNIGKIDSRFKYVCQHSMLAMKYNFYGGKFVIVEDPDIIIEDFICDTTGKCALSCVVFLKEIINNLDIIWDSCIKHKNRDKRHIEKSWPKFTWPQGMKEASELSSRVKRFLKTSWWEQYIPENPTLARLTKLTLPILAVLGVCWASAKAATWIWEWISKFLGFGPQSKGDANYGNPTRLKVKKIRKTRTFATQSTQNFENKLDKIAYNYITIKSGNTTITAWGVRGSTFLLPKHLLGVVQSSEEFYLGFPTREEPSILMRSDNLDINLIPDRDLCSCSFKQGKILFKDCSKFLQKRSVTDWLDRTGVIMQVENNEIFDVEVQIMNVIDYTTATNSRGRVFGNHGSVVYNYQKPGLCGSLLCVDSIHPIISMHISGSESLNKGIGVILYQEDFEVQGASIEDLEISETISFGNECAVTYVGTVEPDFVAYIPTKSSIIPSSIAKHIKTSELISSKPLTYPAFLSKSGPLSYNNVTLCYSHEETPLIYGVRKNGKPTRDFKPSYVERAFKEVAELMLAGDRLPSQYIQVMNVHDAVMGINTHLDEEDPLYFGKLPLDTSSGWPYSCSSIMRQYGIQKKTKDAWISVSYNEEGYPESCVIHPKILEDHDKNMFLRKQGIVAFNVFQDCLKDERRKIDKVLSEGGTRLFSMSNIEGSIALRRYTLSLTNHIHNNRISNGCCIGINPESVEWTFLAETLRRHPNYFTTDFQNFGAGLNYYCGLKFKDLIILYFKRANVELTQEDINVIECLILELMGSYHIAHKTIYRTFSGSPSGACITVEINSFVHLMYVLICWIIVCDLMYEKKYGIEKLKYIYPELYEYLEPYQIEMTPEDFAGNVIACVYGDDGIFSVSDEFVSVFNGIVINLILKEHNIGVTDSKKSAALSPTVPFNQCTFLKRTFSTHPLSQQMFVAQIDWITIEECIKWTHKSDIETNEQRTRENCIQSLRLAWGYGPEKYAKWQDIINDLLLKVKIRPIHITWNEISRDMFPDLCTLLN